MFSSVDFVISSYSEIFKLTSDTITKVGDEIPIPKFSSDIIIDLFQTGIDFFKNQNRTLLRLSGNYCIIGDSHGQIHNVLRVFLTYGLKSNKQYIFLGDYVDRGEYSVELFVLLLALAIRYPRNFYLLRGNHEFRDVNKKNGLYNFIVKEYGDESIWECMNTVFDYLPFAALIESKLLCVHAGITKRVKTLEEIEKICLPASNFQQNPIIEDIVWSDPAQIALDNDKPNDSRNHGFYYSKLTVHSFMHSNGISKIVKGHVPVDGAAEIFSGLVSVHTASVGTLRGGFLVCTAETGKLQHVKLENLKFVSRGDAFFFKAQAPNSLLSGGEEGETERSFTSRSVRSVALFKHKSPSSTSFKTQHDVSGLIESCSEQPRCLPSINRCTSRMRLASRTPMPIAAMMVIRENPKACMKESKSVLF